MAIDVNDIQTGVSSENLVEGQNVDTVSSGTESVGDAGVSSASGLSVSELMDPNSIKVTIADTETPIVVLMGLLLVERQ